VPESKPGDRLLVYMAAGAKDGPSYTVEAEVVEVTGDKVILESRSPRVAAPGDWITGWDLIPEPWIDPDVMD
jgi:hypothetical protein